jgi:hypothetical protein
MAPLNTQPTSCFQYLIRIHGRCWRRCCWCAVLVLIHRLLKVLWILLEYVSWSLSHYTTIFLRIGSPNLSLDADAGMDILAALHDKRSHHLAWVRVNHNSSAGGLLHQTVVGNMKYSNCAEAGDGDHVVSSPQHFEALGREAS